MNENDAAAMSGGSSAPAIQGGKVKGGYPLRSGGAEPVVRAYGLSLRSGEPGKRAKVDQDAPPRGSNIGDHAGRMPRRGRTVNSRPSRYI